MKKVRVAGYVKLAKLWEKSREQAIPYHNDYYQNKYRDSDFFTLTDVYVDITGAKRIINRPEMLRLITACFEGKVECIAVQTKGYLAADAREFCYLFKLLSDVGQGIHFVTEDDNYNINTITNEENQREALLEMAEKYISLNPSDYEKWKSAIQKKCGLGGDQS